MQSLDTLQRQTIELHFGAKFASVVAVIIDLRCVPTVEDFSTAVDKTTGLLRVRLSVANEHAATIHRLAKQGSAVVPTMKLQFFIYNPECPSVLKQNFLQALQTIDGAVVTARTYVSRLTNLTVEVSRQYEQDVLTLVEATPGLYSSKDALRTGIRNYVQKLRTFKVIELDIDGAKCASVAIILTLQEIPNLVVKKIVCLDLITSLTIETNEAGATKVLDLIATTAGPKLKSANVCQYVPENQAAAYENIVFYAASNISEYIDVLKRMNGVRELSTLTYDSITQVRVLVEQSAVVELQKFLQTIPGIVREPEAKKPDELYRIIVRMSTVSVRAVLILLREVGEHTVELMVTEPPNHTKVTLVCKNSVLEEFRMALMHIPDTSIFDCVLAAEKDEIVLHTATLPTAGKTQILRTLLTIPGLQVLRLETDTICVSFQASKREGVEKLLPVSHNAPKKRRRVASISEVYVPTTADEAPIPCANPSLNSWVTLANALCKK
jgi:hypothetical protein